MTVARGTWRPDTSGRMNDSTTSVSADEPASSPGLRCRQILNVLVIACVAGGVFTSCSHDPDRPKKKRKPRHRDPVEQKVFYDGWWPERR